MNSLINTEKVKESFENMNYPSGEIENLEEAKDWLKALHTIGQYKVDEENGTVQVSDFSKIEGMIKHVRTNKIHFPPLERASFLIRFAKEIENHSSTISQIEAKVRGISMRDTLKQALPYLCQSLIFYSSYAAKPVQELLKPLEMDAITVQIFSDKSYLGLLGCTIGAAIANGHRVILQTAPKITAVVAFILNLTRDISVPENVFALIPGNINVNLFFNGEVDVITAVDNFFDQKYADICHTSKIFTGMHTNFRSPMIVFKDSDQDSALESVIESAWSYLSLLPWSVNELLLDESIFDSFLLKLKQKLSDIKIGSAQEKFIDIAINDEYDSELENIIKRCKKSGLEVFQPKQSSFPLLLIGGKLELDDYCGPLLLNVRSFRNAKEAVTLANNTRQGLAASVWTQNLDLAEEVAEILKVTNVWINSHGIFTPLTPITFHKMSGVGSFGGREGCFPYVSKITDFYSGNSSVAPTKLLQNYVSTLLNKQNDWKKLNFLERYDSLIQPITKETNNKMTQEFNLNNIYESMQYLNKNFAYSQGNLTLKCIREPLGIVLIEVDEKNKATIYKVITASLLLGNGVILLFSEINEENNLCNVFPSNVPIIGVKTSASERFSVLVEAGRIKEIDAIFISSHSFRFDGLKIGEMKKIYLVNDSWEVAFSQACVCKNVWSTKKHSF